MLQIREGGSLRRAASADPAYLETNSNSLQKPIGCLSVLASSTTKNRHGLNLKIRMAVASQATIENTRRLSPKAKILKFHRRNKIKKGYY